MRRTAWGHGHFLPVQSCLPEGSPIPVPTTRPANGHSCCSGGWEAHTAGQQLGTGRGADSWLGSFVGHGGELVADAAQAV